MATIPSALQIDIATIQASGMCSMLKQKKNEIWRFGLSSDTDGDLLGHPEQVT